MRIDDSVKFLRKMKDIGSSKSDFVRGMTPRGVAAMIREVGSVMFFGEEYRSVEVPDSFPEEDVAAISDDVWREAHDLWQDVLDSVESAPEAYEVFLDVFSDEPSWLRDTVVTSDDVKDYVFQLAKRRTEPGASDEEINDVATEIFSEWQEIFKKLHDNNSTFNFRRRLTKFYNAFAMQSFPVKYFDKIKYCTGDANASSYSVVMPRKSFAKNQVDMNALLLDYDPEELDFLIEPLFKGDNYPGRNNASFTFVPFAKDVPGFHFATTEYGSVSRNMQWSVNCDFVFKVRFRALLSANEKYDSVGNLLKRVERAEEAFYDKYGYVNEVELIERHPEGYTYKFDVTFQDGPISNVSWYDATVQDFVDFTKDAIPRMENTVGDLFDLSLQIFERLMADVLSSE